MRATHDALQRDIDRLDAGARDSRITRAEAEPDWHELGAGAVRPQHYAFLVTEDDLDSIFERIRERDLQYWADPSQTEPGEINTWDGGRGVYFEDPNGHLLEAIKRSYGTGGSTTAHPHPLVNADQRRS